MVKNLPAMRETWAQSLSLENPLEKQTSGSLVGPIGAELKKAIGNQLIGPVAHTGHVLGSGWQKPRNEDAGYGYGGYRGGRGEACTQEPDRP